MTRRRHVYGPVGSRRYGLSLGVDPHPRKICCYDCVYCQQGRTTRVAISREDLVDLADILSDTREALDRGPAPEVITLAGSGEPTLYRSLRALVAGLRSISSLPVVLITNGALLDDPDVLAAASMADIVCPSLDAADPDTFRRINRPHPDIDFHRMVDGLRSLRGEAQGTYHLEVLIAAGVNDSPEHLEALARLADSIAPDAIHLNTAVRPHPGPVDLAVDPGALGRIARIFGSRAEVIAGGTARAHARSEASAREVLEVLERRPCTAEDLSSALGLHPGEVLDLLDAMGREGLVVPAGEEGCWRASAGRKGR